jgi:hypothetical protein
MIVVPMHLSERQMKAQALTNELHKQFPDSVFVVSPLPLNDATPLRCQIINSPSSAYENTLEVLRSWGYEPRMLGNGLRFGYAARGCTSFAIDLPVEDRTVVADDRQSMPRFELAGDKKTDKELEALRKHFGGFQSEPQKITKIYRAVAS